MSEIDLRFIRTDGGTQSRATINDDVVADYAEAVRGGADLPPVVLYYDGSVYWLADGFHRVAAYKAAGAEEISAEVRAGTRRDAVLYSVGANAAHGLRRSNEDKRRAVETLLRDDEWSAWSDREIARQCNVSHTFVSKIRGPVTGNIASETLENDKKTIFRDRHGNKAEMRTGNIGKPTPVAVAEKTTPATNTASEPAQGRDDVVVSSVCVESEEDVLRQENEALRAEIERLKGKIAELSAIGHGPVISKLQKQKDAADLKRRDALDAAKRMEYRLKQEVKLREAAEKRVRELEGGGIRL